MTKAITRVKDVMHSEVLTIDGMATSKEAAERMRAHGVSEILVQKRNEDDAWAIVSIMDLVKKVIVPGKEAGQIYVYEIMTKPIITVPADMDIRYAVRLIHRFNIHRAPVEHNGEIVGMVTLDALILDNDLL